MSDKRKTYVLGPVQRSLTPEEFMEMRARVAKLYADDAERLRRLLDDGGPSTVS